MKIFYGFRLRTKSGVRDVRSHPILPPPLNMEARERLRWRIVDLEKNPVEMNEDELCAWLLSMPDDELNELLALSDWTHPGDRTR